jgi:hypothetical protein
MKAFKIHCFAKLDVLIVIMIISAKRYLALIIISPFFSKLGQAFPRALFTLDVRRGNTNDVRLRNARSNELHLDSADTRAHFFYASSRDRWFASSCSTFNNRESRLKIIRYLRSGRSAIPLDSFASMMMKYHIIEAFLSPRSLMNFR